MVISTTRTMRNTEACGEDQSCSEDAKMACGLQAPSCNMWQCVVELENLTTWFGHDMARCIRSNGCWI